MAKDSTPPALHELEAEVMEAMWQREAATVREIMAACNAAAERERAYTTYMTIMSRLATKGLLSRKREGKTDVYSVRVGRDQYRELRAGADVDRLLAEFGDAALVHFTRALDRLDPARVQELRRHARRS